MKKKRLKMNKEKQKLKECDFCGKRGNWINVLRDIQISKKDGSYIILCNNCLNNYTNGNYNKIKLKAI